MDKAKESSLSLPEIFAKLDVLKEEATRCGDISLARDLGVALIEARFRFVDAQDRDDADNA